MKHATVDDLLSLPEHQMGEIIDGDLCATPRPRSRHARAATRLTSCRRASAALAAGPV